MNSVVIAPGAGDKSPCLAVSEGGLHAAEALVLARYFMFTQVYFHKTRVAFDHHLLSALREILPGRMFPRPIGNELKEFLRWDDWRVSGALSNGNGGEHGRRLMDRDHYQEVYHTRETPNDTDLETLARVKTTLGSLLRAEEPAEKSWYKLGKSDISIISDNPSRAVEPLSAHSVVVAKMTPIRRVMLFCRKEDVQEARQKVQAVTEA